MPRMYHPDLEPPNNEVDVPDDEGCVRVHAESGWKVVPEPTAASPAHAPTVTYAPVTPDEPAAPKRRSKPTTDTD